ncbi:MAG: hypothetical protein NUW14_07940 [Deltaproteobacteria bacterium]|nr:hypothetical protein [Deltaproteobacteria bacterium]
MESKKLCAITNRGNPQRTLPTIRLWNVHPQHRLRVIPPLLQVLGKLVEEALDAFTFDILDADPVDARASSVGSYFLPSPPQNVGPDETVIQSMEPAVPVPLGRQVKSALELS